MTKPYTKLASKILLAGAVAFSIIGCKKDKATESVKAEAIAAKSKNIKTFSITPETFNWEVGDYMPTPSSIHILKPWAAGANQSFPQIYTTDIKKSDGWELVYNTFNTTTLVEPSYFVLYNKYRGVLRGYFYLKPGTPIPSSYISHTLIQRTLGSDAPLLSYSGNSAADLSITTNNTNLVQQYKTTATGTWYAAEFEMTYDPKVATKNAVNNTMTWQINSINASNLSINGTSQGSITGTIAQPLPPGPGIFGNLISGALDFVGFKALGAIAIKASTPKATSELVTSLKDAAKDGLIGQAKNIANGIFGGATDGGDSTKQYVHLTTNTNYQLTGTSTDIYTLANPSLIIPGSSGQSSVPGYIPLYTKALGIMTLSAAPTATLTNYDYSMYPDSYPNRNDFKMKLNNNSYTIIWNPNIINSNSDGASVQNIRKEIISYENYLNSNITDDWDWPGYANQIESDGFNKYLKTNLSTTNEISIKTYSNCPTCDNFDLITASEFIVGKKLPKHVLRITFDIVPNNGSPKITVVKSFNIILSAIVV